MCRWRKAWISSLGSGALSLTLFGAPAVAAVPEADPRFAIAGYEVSGVDFLPAALIESTLKPFTGEGQDFEAIQRAVEALQHLLQDRGYHTARVFLPEQEVADGRIRLRVVVAVLGNLEVDGNQHHDEANIRASVPSLKVGVAPDTAEIAAELRVANENPSKQTRLVFRQSRNDGEVDAVLRVADESPMRVGFLLDNTGNEATGNYRIGVLAQHANLFNADHAVSLQAMTSPGHLREVRIVGLGYRLPLYRLGDSMDFAFGYSNVDSGSVSSAAGDFDISGSGRIFSVRYNHFLPRWGELDHKLLLGYDRRAYSNEIRASGIGGESLIPDITVNPVSLTYAPTMRFGIADGSANLSYARNIPTGNDGDRDAFARTGIRQGADPEYSLWRFGGSLAVRIADGWEWRGDFNGQWTDDLLVPGEQFGIGGASSVRGFGERAVAADKGIRGTMEVLTPNLAESFGLDKASVKVLVFADAGEVRQNRPQPGEIVKEGIASYGIGVRVSIGRHVSARLDAAEVASGDGVTRPGDHRLHGQLLLVY